MQTDIDTVKQRVLEVARQSKVAAQIENVSVEPDSDDEGTDFLRVIISLRSSDHPDEAEFEALLENIERAVGAVDERYPSVRFLDAA